ncbi:protein kinase domain-containing protein [Archangium lansingense]|uniref:serine/threonine-protein kinase n=1 Tax=Archangium lansingense TaxID=2995310 RepID=UPI003B784D9D
MDSTLTSPASAQAPLASSPPAGTVIAGRFTLQSLAGRGGMGAVYRATDSLSGQPVALKLLHPSPDPDSSRRFTREASVLAELRHPGIVAYVAHGLADNGLPFLAMQWLEGEDLAQRLARQPLSLQETLSLLRHATLALCAAHHHGVIHRDLKPSNLFLRHGRPEDVVLLDFGLARHAVPSTAMTASQMLLGTPGYMAPEQVSHQAPLTAAADVFSLGCVLYECLTGQPPFRAPHLVATLAKILFAEPTPLGQLRPELPVAVQELVEHMLAKEPTRRLPQAQGLLNALEKLQARLETGPDLAAPPGALLPGLADSQQQLVTVLLAAPRATAGQTSKESDKESDSRLTLRDSLRTLLASQGARVELLADGALVLTLVASLGSATDPAALAARCALSLLERWPEAVVALATGRGSLDAHLPVGEAMDRAGQLLRQVESLPPDSTPVLLDEVTAGLLGPGFQLSRPQSNLFLLHGEQWSADTSRPLLGKPTPCVGREHELAMLDMAFTTCVQESTAQGVLVTAPAGAGKSRLRHEFLRRLERQHPEVMVLLGRGDPMSAGSADGLLAQALSRLCGLSGGEPLEVRRERLSERLARHLPASQAREVTGFLGELCASPFPEEHSPRLRAARGDPQVMSTQVGRALVAFLQAECAHHPVLLVLEDLHWGDMLSVRLMDEALRELAEQPFMVLALARPEVEQLLPGSWARRMQEVPLRGLSRKAGARLVREVLGPQVPDALIDRLVEQAAGSALFLEELIRGVAEGQGEAAPRTVLAMLQSRLGRLEPQARQVLLAASFLGRAFWPGGVRALLGQEFAAAEVERWLRGLVELEWVEPQPSSRFPGEEEYRFRHALVRDAAHGLVPDSHKPTGHRLAGAWLEQVGERDPQVLGEHARLGEQPERAIHFYLQAAEQLFKRHDMPSTMRCVETARAMGAQGAELLRLRAIEATTAFWMGDFAKLFATGGAVLAELKPGSVMWCWLANGLYTGFALSGQWEQADRLTRRLWSAQPEPEARGTYLEALGNGVMSNTQRGSRQEVATYLARLLEVSAEAPPEAPLERAWSTNAQGIFACFFEDRPWQASLWQEQSLRDFLEAGLERPAMGAQFEWGLMLEALGDRAGAERQLREAVAFARRLEQPVVNLFAELHLALFLSSSPEPAHHEEVLALTSGWQVGHISFFAGVISKVRARVAAARGELGEAEQQARQAREKLTSYLFEQLSVLVLLSGVLLAQGRAAEAREVAASAARELEALGGSALPTVGVYLALAEACLAEGDVPEGEAALRRALQCLRTRVADIPDAAARERFLHQVPENARTLELARQRWGTAEVPCQLC